MERAQLKASIVTGAALSVLGGAAWCLLWAGSTALSAASIDSADFDALLAACATALAALCLVRLAVDVMVAALLVLPGLGGAVGHRAAASIRPGLGRRAAQALLGLTVATAPCLAAAPAWAAPVAVHVSDAPGPVSVPSVTAPRAPAAQTAGPGSLLELPLLDRPQAAAPRAGLPRGPAAAEAATRARWTPPAPRRVRSAAAVTAARLATANARPDHDADVVVRRGDTLWDIAARHAGPQATATEIARAWPRWWAANRHTIGADPDLLLPGTRLRPPG